jgi:hypothetical protein
VWPTAASFLVAAESTSPVPALAVARTMILRPAIAAMAFALDCQILSAKRRAFVDTCQFRQIAPHFDRPTDQSLNRAQVAALLARIAE